MFVKFKQAIPSKGRAIGDVVEIADAEAKGLIDLDIVEKYEKPPEVAEVLSAAVKDISDTINTTMAAGFKAMAEQLQKNAPKFDRGGLEIGDNPEINVENMVVHGRLKNFSNDAAGRREAYRFGMYCMGIYHNDPATKTEGKQRSSFATGRCKDLGIPLTWKEWDDAKRVVKTLADNNNTSAGFLVPEEFQNGMIVLREKFGKFRQNAEVMPMKGDSLLVPRQRGAVAANFVGEGAAGTPADPTFDLVKLTTKKLITLTYYTSEINEDVTISLGDKLAGDIAYAFANKEDACGFIGDGTSTYGGVIGVAQSLKNVSAIPTSTIADVLGIYQTTHNSYATVTLADLNTVVGLLPEFADTPNCKWYMHRTFWGGTVQRLLTAGGGNAVSDLEGGARRKMCLGYEVEVVQVMPKAYAANQIVAYLGDLAQAAMIGDRRQTTVSLSDQYLFNQDVIAIRGTERFDINVHDVGEMATQTARDPVMGVTAGPIVGLMLT